MKAYSIKIYELYKEYVFAIIVVLIYTLLIISPVTPYYIKIILMMIYMVLTIIFLKSYIMLKEFKELSVDEYIHVKNIENDETF